MALLRQTAMVGGRSFVYNVAGEGDPLVLVHGLAGSGRWWRRNLPALSAHYRVYLVDLPWFGASRRHGGSFVLSAEARWLHAWMLTCGVEAAHLVGHSLGGNVCIRLAATHPEAVRRLALIAPAGVGPRRSLPGHSIPLIQAAWRASPSFLPLLAGDSLRAGPLTLVRAARQLLAEDVSPLVGTVLAPTLVVLGERDPLIPLSVGPLIQSMLAPAQVVVVPRAGHVVMYDRPREFERALLEFLAADAEGEGHTERDAGADV